MDPNERVVYSNSVRGDSGIMFCNENLSGRVSDSEDFKFAFLDENRKLFVSESFSCHSSG